MATTDLGKKQVVTKACGRFERRCRSVCRTALKNGVAVEMIAYVQVYGRSKKLPPNHAYVYIGGPRVSLIREEVKDILVNGLLTGKTSAVVNEKSVRPLLEYLSKKMRWSQRERVSVDRATSDFFKVQSAPYSCV